MHMFLVGARKRDEGLPSCFSQAWAALSDILLAVYPVVFFWSLKISNKIKIGLCLLMAGGLMYALPLSSFSPPRIFS